MLANERATVTEAVRLADLWLDDVTAFPSGIRKIEAWSQSEWLEATFPVWSALCEPIAVKGIDAMSSMLNVDPSQLREDMPEEMRTAPRQAVVTLEQAAQEAEKAAILAALTQSNQHRERAAALLDVSVRTLHYKMNRYGLQ